MDCFVDEDDVGNEPGDLGVCPYSTPWPGKISCETPITIDLYMFLKQL